MKNKYLFESFWISGLNFSVANTPTCFFLANYLFTNYFNRSLSSTFCQQKCMNKKIDFCSLFAFLWLLIKSRIVQWSIAPRFLRGVFSSNNGNELVYRGMPLFFHHFNATSGSKDEECIFLNRNYSPSDIQRPLTRLHFIIKITRKIDTVCQLIPWRFVQSFCIINFSCSDTAITVSVTALRRLQLRFG